MQPKEKKSFDTNDFDISFARGLSLEDGVTTLTDFTACVIAQELTSTIIKSNQKIKEVLICGGGRKNKVLLKKIKENLSRDISLKLIDDYKVNGDFVESQAFAYLSIRSIMRLPISFPNTTGCKNPTIGGKFINLD